MTKRALTERQMRWAQTLSRYNFRLDHRPGRKCVVPDALSRREQDMPKDASDDRITERNQVLLPESLWIGIGGIQDGTASREIANPFEDTLLQELWDKAIQDNEGREYVKAKEIIERGDRQFPAELRLQVATGDCDIKGGRLRYREKLWLPTYEPLTTGVIQHVHDSIVAGHPGRDATVAMVIRQFFWPGMNKDIRRFVRNCDVCGRTTVWRDKKKGLLKPLPVPERIWQHISMDFIVDLPLSDGCTILLVITDRLGKGTILIPVPPDKFDALGTAELFIRHYIGHHWLPKSIVTDRGQQWANGFWKRVCELLKIERRLSTAYHPETDGATERKNQEVEMYLRAFVTYNQGDWVQWLPAAQACLNGKQAASTGLAPFFLSHGYDIEVVSIEDHDVDARTKSATTPRAIANVTVAKLRDAYEWAQAAMAAAQQNQEDQANKRRSTPSTYKVGDKVWLHLKNFTTNRPCKKLDWLHGKYTITRAFPNSHVYELDVLRNVHKKFHTSLLRPAAIDPLPSQ